MAWNSDVVCVGQKIMVQWPCPVTYEPSTDGRVSAWFADASVRVPMSVAFHRPVIYQGPGWLAVQLNYWVTIPIAYVMIIISNGSKFCFCKGSYPDFLSTCRLCRRCHSLVKVQFCCLFTNLDMHCLDTLKLQSGIIEQRRSDKLKEEFGPTPEDVAVSDASARLTKAPNTASTNQCNVVEDFISQLFSALYRLWFCFLRLFSIGPDPRWVRW